jgi:hypothetical protein
LIGAAAIKGQRGPRCNIGETPAHEQQRKIAGRRSITGWRGWSAAASQCHGERIVPNFIGRGAPAFDFVRFHDRRFATAAGCR